MNLSDYVVSVVRTAVPAGVGALIAWLASLGANVGAEAGVGLTVGITGATIAVYYAFVRALEPKLPAFLRVLLLGAARAPDYGIVTAPASRQVGNPGVNGGRF